jgi:transposase-like protein
MDKPALFTWRHVAEEIIVCGVRWYHRFALGYHAVDELTRERGDIIDHTALFRWVPRYAPELDKRCRS